MTHTELIQLKEAAENGECTWREAALIIIRNQQDTLIEQMIKGQTNEKYTVC